MTDVTLQPEAIHEALGPEFYDPVRPARFPREIVRFANGPWARRIGLGGIEEADWLRYFARFKPMEGSLSGPLALRYVGHQFRVFNPDIGDGRGFLYAQLRDPVDGRLLDFGTKGSGTTPYSRGGDGRLTLKGAVREVLATEMLEALGVYTSKTFSVIETGEALIRGDEPSPTRSAVLTRLSHSHIRFGSFQRMAAHRKRDEIEALVAHSIAHYWPEATDIATLYELIIQATARLGAEWFAAGFVHGVLNTDNVSITGESFDYGPWRFLDRFDPDFTAAYFDHSGLYCFGRQPEALQWNLARLGECLAQVGNIDVFRARLPAFTEHFQDALTRQTFARLGLLPGGTAQSARDLMKAFWEAMHQSAAPVQRVFFDLLGGGDAARLRASPVAEMYREQDWRAVLRGLDRLPAAPGLEAALATEYAQGDGPQTMVIEEVEEIWSHIDRNDDWGPFERKIAAVRRAGAFGRTLGLLSGLNARPRHDPTVTAP